MYITSLYILKNEVRNYPRDVEIILVNAFLELSTYRLLELYTHRLRCLPIDIFTRYTKNKKMTVCFRCVCNFFTVDAVF